MRELRKFVAISIALFGALYGIAMIHGCFPVDKKVEAAAGYEAQQLACVDRYADKSSIDKCRDKVKASWASDAGKDASE